MRQIIRSLLFSGATAVLSVLNTTSFAACPPDGYSIAQLQDLKTHQWRIADPQQRQQLATSLSDCLADSNPILRDEIAFEALSHWMREGLLSTATVQGLRTQLLQRVRTPVPTTDPGFSQPFAALVLAEIARVDRLQAFMTTEQRQDMVDAAADYLPAVRDFRGFDEQQGWRHGVAHGADWMLQLALNPALNHAQQLQILHAVATPVRNDQHFYHYGESSRLMAPVFYLARRSDISNEEWAQWFNDLLPIASAAEITNQARLARHHNLTTFFHALYINLQETPTPTVREKLLPLVIKSLKKLN